MADDVKTESYGRYAIADSLEGMSGFDRDKFMIADSARSWIELMPRIASWNAEGATRCREEAARRFQRLRDLRRRTEAKDGR